MSGTPTGNDIIDIAPSFSTTTTRYRNGSNDTAVGPTDHGYAAYPFDPAVCASSTAVGSGSVQTIRVIAVDLRTVTAIAVIVGTAGSGLTADQRLAALYDSNGNQLAVAGD